VDGRRVDGGGDVHEAELAGAARQAQVADVAHQREVGVVDRDREVDLIVEGRLTLILSGHRILGAGRRRLCGRRLGDRQCKDGRAEHDGSKPETSEHGTAPFK
jgi:hypothetical protein